MRSTCLDGRRKRINACLAHEKRSAARATDASTARSRGIDVTGPDTTETTSTDGVVAEGAVAAQGPHALIVARFADPTLAMSAYDDLIDAEVAGFARGRRRPRGQGGREAASSTSRR